MVRKLYDVYPPSLKRRERKDSFRLGQWMKFLIVSVTFWCQASLPEKSWVSPVWAVKLPMSLSSLQRNHVMCFSPWACFTSQDHSGPISPSGFHRWALRRCCRTLFNHPHADRCVAARGSCCLQTCWTLRVGFKVLMFLQGRCLVLTLTLLNDFEFSYFWLVKEEFHSLKRLLDSSFLATILSHLLYQDKDSTFTSAVSLYRRLAHWKSGLNLWFQLFCYEQKQNWNMKEHQGTDPI